MTAGGPPPGPGQDLAARPDAELLAQLRNMWDEQDPAPPHLAERVAFALSLEHLEAELLRLESNELVGARGEERVRTVTFTSDSLTVMVTLGARSPEGIRVDGWIAGGGGLRVELRTGTGSFDTTADTEGRFVLEAVPQGLVQLAFLPTPGAVTTLARTVVTPGMEV